MTKTKLGLFVTASVAASLLGCGNTWAQASAPDQPASAQAAQIEAAGQPAAVQNHQAGMGVGGTTVESVIVTANKRAERVVDVPMSIVALTGADLARTQTLDLQDLSARVPGLNIIQGGYGNGTTIILRGLNTGTGAATVASVLDEVPLSISGPLSTGASFGADIDPYDLDRIEVLKGPQGTLYGASALGGLIKYVSKAPDPNGYHGGYELGLTDLAHAGPGGSGKGYVNIPLLNGTAAFRASGFYEYSPGWIDENLIGQPKTNSFNRFGGRASLLWRPTQDLTVRVSAFAQVKRSDGLDNVTVNGLGKPNNQYGLLNGYDFHSYLFNPSRNTSQLYSADVSYDLHFARIESITSYGALHQTFALDSSVYGDLGLFGPGTTLDELGRYGINKKTEEVRFTSEPGATLFGRGLEWQIGGFYTNEEAAGLNHYLTVKYPTGQPVSTFFGAPEVFFTDLPSTYEELAAYVDATYHFTSKFDLELGGRVFHDNQKFDQTEGGGLFGFPITNQGLKKSSETDETFSSAARYHFTPNSMIYGRIASGYRPGGPQTIIPGGPPTCGGSVTTNCLADSFKPDRTINYEAGVKGQFFHRMLSVDLAAFYIDWSNVQVNVTQIVGPPGVNCNDPAQQAQCAAYPFTANVGKAKSQGVEGTLVLSPLRGLDLTASGSFADATLSVNGAPGSNAHKGDQLPYNTKFSGTLSADYEWAIANDYRAFVGGSYSYLGKRFDSFSTRASQSHLEIPSYQTVSAQIGIRNGPFAVEFYGKNLADEKGITYYYPGLTGGLAIPAAANLIRPRTLGIRVTGDF